MLRNAARFGLMKKVLIGTRVSPETREALRLIAALNGDSSISAEIRKAVTAHIEAYEAKIVKAG